jgi:hypothetical protein
MNRRTIHILLGIVALLMMADFIFRGLIPALHPGKNDFTEIYTGAWLWRHGQNFYDPALATQTSAQLTGAQNHIALVYPPTTLILAAPLTFLSWFWASLIWFSSGLVAIALTCVLLIRLSGLQFFEQRALLLATFVLVFDPLHQAFHLGNIAIFVVPICFWGVYLAEGNYDFLAGIILAIATALKPQLGLWFLVFYFMQLRKKLFAGSLLIAFPLFIAMTIYPVQLSTLFQSYRNNLQYWFGEGGLYGFTEGALPFHLNNSQVIFYELLHSTYFAKALSYGLFLAGLIVWLISNFKAKHHVSFALAISSLLALSFIAFYHSVSDVTVLTLALCWTYQKEPSLLWSKRITWIIFLLLMLPGHSLLMRIIPHLNSAIIETWWWKILVARYYVWLLIALISTLLYSLYIQNLNPLTKNVLEKAQRIEL